MIHFLEFFQKYNGKNVDVDGYPKGNPNQCTDLMRKYCEEVLGIGLYALPTAAEAKGIFNATPFNHKYFKKTVNMPWNVPKQGDIIFWKEPLGRYKDDNGIWRYAGHVAIVNTANVRTLTSFDQNFSPDLKCRLVTHDYKACIGWLSFKGK